MHPPTPATHPNSTSYVAVSQHLFAGKPQGQTFDALSPTSGNIDQVRKGISKKVKEEQANRIVLNLNDTGVGPDDVRAILGRKPIEGLQEVIGIQGTSIVQIFP